jgi:hypothetical protein
MGILRTDRVTGLGGANAIKGSVNFTGSRYAETYFDIDASTDFAFGTGDFTIECWINLTHDDADNYYKRVYMTDGPTGNASGNFQIAIVPSTGVVNLWEVSGSLDVSGSTKVTKAGWVHIAAVRSGSGSNNLKLYVDGVQDLQTTYTTSISPNSGNPRPRIGAYAKDTGGSLPGHVSNLRVSNEALYTSAFTRPTTELTKLSSTILLCFQSPGNIIKEETDKILVPNRVKSTSNFPTASRFTPNSPVGFSTTTDVGTQFGSTFDGVTTFDSQAYMVPPGGNTRERNRGRGIFADGDSSKTIEFINIQSMGNSQDFGDSTTDFKQRASVSSSTRTVTGGGFSSPNFTNILDFITIASTSNATDFGDLLTAKRNMGGAGNNTRGIYLGGGNPGNTNTIEFITIATAGNAQDFGDATAAKSGVGSLASPTRACFGGGQDNTIEFVTISTTGNAQDFGDLISGQTEKPAGTSSSTRGLFICGESQPSGTRINTIQFITIASTGDATDFGDHTDLRRSLGACNNSIRAVYGGGNTPSGTVNTLSFVTIATTGNGQDFGDLLTARSTALTATSDSHGGLE